MGKAGAPLILLMSLVLRMFSFKILKPSKKIIIIDLHLIGDIVLLTPLLKSISQGYPNHHLTLVAGNWACEILKGDILVDEIIQFTAPWVKKTGFRGYFDMFNIVKKLRQTPWDIGIDVRGDVRQQFMLAAIGANRRISFNFTGGGVFLTDIVPDDGKLAHLANHHQRIAEYLGILKSSDIYQPFLSITPDEHKNFKDKIPYIGFHFGASVPLRRLPIDTAIKLINSLSTRKYSLILFSTPEEQQFIDIILSLLPQNVRENVSVWSGNLRDLIIKISFAHKVIAMDSGVAHISAALGIETHVIFGPNLPEYVAPIGKNVHVIESKGLSCRPCNQKKCVNPVYQACMLNLEDQLLIRGKNAISISG